MIQSKIINVIVAIAVIFALIISLAFVMIGNTQGQNDYVKTDAEYATEIFGSDIISIEIIADEDDWQEMLDNAINEQYIMVDVVVNGEKFENVGIRPKGNSSLSQVVNSDSDRYSFRLKFDEYIEGQTCFGLDSFVVNNMIGDNTYMKEYVSYELMEEIGVDAPYFGFADIKVNGEDWGFYLAVETYGDSYETRTFGTISGMMYSVKNAAMERNDEMTQDNVRPQPNGEEGNFPSRDMAPPTNMEGDQAQLSTQTNQQEGNFNRTMENRESGGGSLEYTTDEISSYSSIFENVVGKGSDSDYKRVITALKALSNGEDLETYFEVDQILRYLAAHTVVVNLDSYSSNMAQNYYIYENDGKITILPWDYNLAWGGFDSKSASAVINFPIDTPVSGVDMSARPLLEKLFSNTEYLERYHDYLQELMTNYFSDGKWEERITELDALISDYVEKDNTSFITFEEYKTAVEAFKTLGNLRYQSIQGQLDGTIPSTTAEQAANPDSLISAGNLDVSLLGSMRGGDKGGDRGGERPNPNQAGNIVNNDLMIQAMQILQDANGTITDEVRSNLLDLGLTEEEISMISQMENRPPQRTDDNMNNPMGNNIETISGNVDFPGGQGIDSVADRETLYTYLGSFTLVLVLTFFIAKKKRNY